MVVVRIIKLKGTSILNSFEQTLPLEDLNEVLKDFLRNFDEKQFLKDKNYFDILLDPSNREIISLVWLQSLI